MTQPQNPQAPQPSPTPYQGSSPAAPSASQAAGFRKLLSRINSHSFLTFPVHPHMVRHGCGYKLVNDGHDTRSIQHYLGHKNIQHTVRYTELSPGCFNDFWQD